MTKNATPRGAGKGKADGKTEQTSKPRATLDWELIERLYRAGQLSIREIAKQCGCGHPQILRYAKRHGWMRSLAGQVRQGVSAALIAGVGSQMTPGGVVNDTTKSAGSEKEIIEAAVATTVSLVREHISELRNGRRLASVLFGQLEEAAVNRDQIEAAIQEATREADDPHASKGAQQAAWVRRGQMLRAVSLPAHAAVLKDLATVLKVIIPMERQAFNVDGAEPPSPEDEQPRGMMDLETFSRKIDAQIASRRAAVA